MKSGGREAKVEGNECLPGTRAALPRPGLGDATGETESSCQRRGRKNRTVPTRQHLTIGAFLAPRLGLGGKGLARKTATHTIPTIRGELRQGSPAGNRFLVHRDFAFLQITPAGLTTNNTNLDINMFRLHFIITSIISTLLINNIFFTATFTTINITICNNFHITTNNMINTFIINITNIINITVMTVTTGLAQPPYLRTRQDQKQDVELRPE